MALGPAQPVVKAAAGHAQRPAQPGNLELLAMPTNERVLHGSSRAKYAAAFFRMSRSSVTFSSSRFKRATSLSSDAGLRPEPRKAFSPLLFFPFVELIASDAQLKCELRSRLLAKLKQTNCFEL